MIARGIVWLGVPSDRYPETVAFFRDLLGCRVEFAEPTTTELSFADGDRVQVFAPDDRYFRFFRSLTAGPVALIEVDDASAAVAELRAADIETIGDVEEDSTWRWIAVRAPDGQVYELASRRT